MIFYIILIEFAAAFSLQVTSEVLTTGTFFKRKENGDEGRGQLSADQPLVTQELFECGRKESCSNTLMYKNTKEHADDAKSESQKKPVDMWEKDIVSCGENYTPWHAHECKMSSLDRHRPDCGPEKVLTMFHLERDAARIRYHYTCCHFKQGVLNMQSRTSLFHSDGHFDTQNGDMVYLDRHTANCSTKGFISALRVERNTSRAEIRYNYQCAILMSNNLMLSCYSAVSPFTEDGGGIVYYLDRQTVECNSGYGLSYIRLERNHPTHGKIRYAYKCCKVN